MPADRAENGWVSIERAFRRLSAAALAVGLGMLLLLGPLATPASAATAVPALDDTFSSLLNGLRSTLGLGGLAVDNEVSAVARTWSEHMATTGVMAHNPNVAGQVGSWSKLGENVGYGGGVTSIFNALVASPGHLRNMSDPEFTRVGIGTVTDARGLVWTTHVFLRPKAAGAAPAPRPGAAPATAPAPPATRAPRAAPAPAARPAATAPPTTVAPPAPAPVEAPVPTTAPASETVEMAGLAPTEASLPPAAPIATAHPSTGDGVPVPLAGAALLGLLLVLGAAGVVVRRGTASDRAAPTGLAADLAATLDLPRT